VVLTAHRKAAFAANEFLINRLKEIVPIWKREYFTDGAVWVDPQLITK
jgi:molybdopterin synthase catalytic subunit